MLRNNDLVSNRQNMTKPCHMSETESESEILRF